MDNFRLRNALWGAAVSYPFTALKPLCFLPRHVAAEGQDVA